MTYDFQTVDVFTNTRFCGNPLAVFVDAHGMDGATMQALASFDRLFAKLTSAMVLLSIGFFVASCANPNRDTSTTKPKLHSELSNREYLTSLAEAICDVYPCAPLWQTRVSYTISPKQILVKTSHFLPNSRFTDNDVNICTVSSLNKLSKEVSCLGLDTLEHPIIFTPQQPKEFLLSYSIEVYSH